MTIKIPLKIENGKLKSNSSIKNSIDLFIELLLSTPCHSFPSDLDFGFVFNNLRFEIFDEQEGVVFNVSKESSLELDASLYEKKLSGSSKNLNTFAAEFCEVINKYECRLLDVNVSMAYKREEKRIYVVVKGIIAQTQQPYLYSTSMGVWN